LESLADDYELFTKIGKGRYSDVYTGFDVVKNRKVIIKILKPGLK
jgi:casein kinase II subunit alpha